MSADNTILILKTKDGYRVEHVQASDNLYFTWAGKDKVDSSRPIAARIFEFFQASRFFKDTSSAFDAAIKLKDEIGYVEYGIEHICVDDTFEEVVIKTIAQLGYEIEAINKMEKRLNFEHRKDITDDLKDTINNAVKWLALHT
jgi:hypothetical protein